MPAPDAVTKGQRDPSTPPSPVTSVDDSSSSASTAAAAAAAAVAVATGRIGWPDEHSRAAAAAGARKRGNRHNRSNGGGQQQQQQQQQQQATAGNAPNRTNSNNGASGNRSSNPSASRTTSSEGAGAAAEKTPAAADMTTPVMGYVSVKDFYRDRSIFITGGTGFMGKVLVEKLLRSCPGIKNIYLLMRPKRGQDVQQRLQELLNAPLFDKLRQDTPHELLKIVPVAGDVTEPELGISVADQEMLIRCVSVVFHSAATVKFDEALKLSVTINMLGTKRLVQLCHRMHSLEALIHVSTAYCNCDRMDVEEKIYAAPHDPEQIIQCTTWMDDSLVEELTPKLIANRPNTYTFTKALAESMLLREAGSLPVAIVRPSIVLSSFREPVAGWVDNWNGPTGIIAAAGKGFFRTMLCHEDKVADLVPVDIVINLMIVAAWRTAIHRSDTIQVYNCSTGQQNPITWKHFVELAFKYSRLHPTNGAIWYPGGRCRNNASVNRVCVAFQHLVPAYALDFLANLRGSKPIMVRVQARLDKAAKCLEYFSTQQWNFKDENVKQLGLQLSADDRQTFMFDVRQIDWPSYLENYILGIRQFILKESPDTLPAARTHITRLYWLHKTVQIGTVLLLMRLLLSHSSWARSAWFSLLTFVLRMCRMIV
uniref:Fatty acyl-CoA reductase n=1 Tax=Trichogramma kaykai TaxID=54128 RepID=A0ABD2WB33_9HYME